jgi:hypothetical protein
LVIARFFLHQEAALLLAVLGACSGIGGLIFTTAFALVGPQSVRRRWSLVVGIAAGALGWIAGLLWLGIPAIF